MLRLGQDDVRVTGGAHLGAHALVRVGERCPGRFRRPGRRLRRTSLISATPDRCQQKRSRDRAASGSEHSAILAEVTPKRKGPPAPCGTGGPGCSGLNRLAGLLSDQKVNLAESPIVRPFRYSTMFWYGVAVSSNWKFTIVLAFSALKMIDR